MEKRESRSPSPGARPRPSIAPPGITIPRSTTPTRESVSGTYSPTQSSVTGGRGGVTVGSNRGRRASPSSVEDAPPVLPTPRRFVPRSLPQPCAAPLLAPSFEHPGFNYTMRAFPALPAVDKVRTELFPVLAHALESVLRQVVDEQVERELREAEETARSEAEARGATYLEIEAAADAARLAYVRLTAGPESAALAAAEKAEAEESAKFSESQHGHSVTSSGSAAVGSAASAGSADHNAAPAVTTTFRVRPRLPSGKVQHAATHPVLLLAKQLKARAKGNDRPAEDKAKAKPRHRPSVRTSFSVPARGHGRAASPRAASASLSRGRPSLVAMNQLRRMKRQVSEEPATPATAIKGSKGQPQASGFDGQQPADADVVAAARRGPSPNPQRRQPSTTAPIERRHTAAARPTFV